VQNTNYEAPNYTNVSSFPLREKIVFGTPLSNVVSLSLALSLLLKTRDKADHYRKQHVKFQF
jgi:hypothetical protein